MRDSAKTWLTIHSYISMFFLPLAIIYAVTGALALTSSHHGPEGSGPPPTMAGEQSGRLQKASGDEQNISNDNRSISGKTAQRHPERNEQADLMGRLLMLHKGAGSTAVKVYGLLFALAMIVIYFSGIWICWCNPNRRRQMLICALAGLVVTVVVVANGLPSAS